MRINIKKTKVGLLKGKKTVVRINIGGRKLNK